MMEYLLQPLSYAFMQRGMAAAVIVGILCAVMGTYVVLRGMAFLGDALAHAILPGIAVAYLVGGNLLIGALVAAIVVALLIGFFSRQGTIKEDTAIGILFAAALALGVALISSIRTYAVDLSHILFGNVLGVSPSDLWMTFGLGLAILVTVFLLYRPFLVVSLLVPEDRQRYGLVQALSVMDNMLLSSLKNYLKGVFLVRKQEKAATEQQIKELSIRVANPQQPITALSGGNQQKVVVAKGLLTQPKILLLDEPTRGIDVGAKSEIFEIMNRLAAQKYSVIFVSSELKEILAMSDRILVMSKGAITGEFSHQDANEEKLVTASAIGHGPSNGGNHYGTGK